MAKTYNQDGKWIDKTTKTEILVCECGNKYIKTREAQATCLRCISIKHRTR